jgi:hypothetical protein
MHQIHEMHSVAFVLMEDFLKDYLRQRRTINIINDFKIISASFLVFFAIKIA